jgi:hypothetical protein
MSNQTSTQPNVSLRIAYESLPDLIELETRLDVGEWKAIANVYTSPDILLSAAQSIREWSFHLRDTCMLEAGGIPGAGLLRLRFYVINAMGHVRCHIRLVSRISSPERVRRMALELQTEPGLVERFANQLEALAKMSGHSAILLGMIS